MNKENWLPSQTLNAQGKARRVGVEFEFAGLSYKQVTNCLQDLYGGSLSSTHPFEHYVKDSQLGEFKVELDAKILKQIAASHQANLQQASTFETTSFDLLSSAAVRFVPWEIVTPPLLMEALPQLERLISALRDLGALGTRHAVYTAFGMHLNPEVPIEDSRCILAYLQAFFCLYDWIHKQESIDISRRLSTYINHFDEEYIQIVIHPQYRPSLTQLVSDYLFHNQTRNRSLDMLPLFAHLKPQQVHDSIQDERIKSRPTFHYRLPNCDIDQPEWALYDTWSRWLMVEALAADEDLRNAFCDAYRQHLDRFSHGWDNRWIAWVEAKLTELGWI
jgi:hypothetical protein